MIMSISLKAVEEKLCALIIGFEPACEILQNTLEGLKDERDVGINMLTSQPKATNMNERESVADFSEESIH